MDAILSKNGHSKDIKTMKQNENNEGVQNRNVKLGIGKAKDMFQGQPLRLPYSSNSWINLFHKHDGQCTYQHNTLEKLLKYCEIVC